MDNYKEIIRNTMKYHYFLKTANKLMRLCSANTKSEAKKQALKQIGQNINTLIGYKLILLIVKRTYPEKNNDLDLIKGNIGFFFKLGLVKSSTKIKNEPMAGGDTIYLSNKYIKAHQDNLIKDYKHFIIDYFNKKLNYSLINVHVL
jgi:hypothetical protein